MEHSEKSQHPAQGRSSSQPLKIDSPDSAHEKQATSFAESVTRNGQIIGSDNTMSGQITGNSNPKNGMIAPAGVKEQINSTQGTGDKLADSVKRMMNGKSGELDEVRIHTDSNAAKLAKSVSAEAFTYGKDIYFGAGKYNPQSADGKRLIAHELTHARQNCNWGESTIQRSAIASLSGNQVDINAHIYFYGSKATTAIAQAATSEINTMWNAPGKASYAGIEWGVKFNVTQSVVTEQEARNLAASNSSRKNNFVRIEANNSDGVSYMEIGKNFGHWCTKDRLGSSTTAAHEFGHGIGMVHTARTLYGQQPGIMAFRGTLVDAKYTYDPSQGDSKFTITDPQYKKFQPFANYLKDSQKEELVKQKKAEFTNTIKPDTRKVLESDLDTLIATGAKNRGFGQAVNTIVDAMGYPSP